jgi:hypothetical protein
MFGLMLLALPVGLAAQAPAQRDSARQLMVEQQLAAGRTARIVVRLERRVVYWLELNGPGTPVIESTERPERLALLIPIGDTTGDTRFFEVYARHSGDYAFALVSSATGASALVRFFRDVAATERNVQRRESALAIGVLVAGGGHSGYRLEAGVGAAPGLDGESCLLAEPGHVFGTCLGAAVQSFPDAGYMGTWLFIEQRARLASTRWWPDRRFDFGAAVRFSELMSIGEARRVYASQLAVGLYVTQFLTTPSRRRGTRLFAEWLHGWLVSGGESQYELTERFTLGFGWVP